MLKIVRCKTFSNLLNKIDSLEEVIKSLKKEQISLDASKITIKDIKPGAKFITITDSAILQRTLHLVDGKWGLYCSPQFTDLTQMGRVNTEQEVVNYMKSRQYIKIN